MKAQFLQGFLMCALMTGATTADMASNDPQKWFEEAYAPLWNDDPGTKVEAILEHYADEVETHEHNGTLYRTAKEEWLGAPMQEWLAEGWLGAELTGLKVDRINASTVAFKARWLDHYESEPQAVSCGWYLADLADGRWQFTAYADLECAAHGL